MPKITLEHRIAKDRGCLDKWIPSEQIAAEFNDVVATGNLNPKILIYKHIEKITGIPPRQAAYFIFEKGEGPKSLLDCLTGLKEQLQEQGNIVNAVHQLSNEILIKYGFYSKSALTEFVYGRLKSRKLNVGLGRLNNFLFYNYTTRIRPWHFFVLKELRKIKKSGQNIERKYKKWDFRIYLNLLEYVYQHSGMRPEEFKRYIGPILGVAPKTIESHLYSGQNIKGLDSRSRKYYDRLLQFIDDSMQLITVDLTDMSRWAHETERFSEFEKLYPGRTNVVVLLNPQYSANDVKRINSFVNKSLMPRKYHIDYVSTSPELENTTIKSVKPYTASQSSRSS